MRGDREWEIENGVGRTAVGERREKGDEPAEPHLRHRGNVMDPSIYAIVET